ncbi:MAG: hypothetical protein PVH53_04290 [Desulfobacterales bacterium]|jgi:hypothetical protein
MKKKSINRLLIAVVLTFFIFTAIPTFVFGQDKFSVSGEITYWWKEGQIIVWLLTKEERKIDKKLIPEERSLKIELDSQNTQEVAEKK